MIKFILKGIIRDRSRSLFPVLTVLLGVALTVLGYCYFSGVMTSWIQTSAKFESGHMKIMSRAYAENADQMPNDLAFIGVNNLIAELKRDFPGLVYAQRIRFGGLFDVPDEQGETKAQGPIAGLAVNLLSEESPERELLNLENAVVRGRLPEKPGEILISDDFARRLDIQSGQISTLIGSTMYGNMATANFTVVGMLRFGISALDRGMMLADLADIQAALDMEDAAGEVLVFSNDFVYQEDAAERIAEAFNTKYSDEEDEFSPVMITFRSQGGMADYMAYVNTFMGVMIFSFIAVMSIVLWNAGLMGSLRRYGEIGVRLALGEDKGHLYRSMIIESLMIGTVGTILGTVLGLAFSYYLQVKGINLGNMMQSATMVINDVIRAKVTPASFVVGFVPGLIATFLGTSISALGIYKRQTSQLMKELEV
ncbi:MAG: FtsX-like permease family protein [Candidatus Aminicenantes bacterium]|nr:MAG: FtsX-like permease family protein [Candidatus Aminicenantes bacterium]